MASILDSGDMGRNISFFVRVHQTNMSYQQLLTIWQAADRLGYDGASLYDLLTVPCLECWTVLTALTMATQRLLTIPLVLAYTYRHPAVLAKMAATLDVVSGGRLILGLGAGGSQPDHEASGIPWWSVQERLARLEDGINVLRFLWSGREGPFSSRYYGTLTGPGYPQPVQQPVQWEGYKEMLERYASKEGREPATVGLTHNATVILSRDPQATRTMVEHYANSRGYPVTNAWQRLEHALVGTPEQCVARLQA